MKFQSIIFLIIPVFAYAEEFDQSTPIKTYESCVKNQPEPLTQDFIKRYLASCTTKQNKLVEIQGMIFAVEFLPMWSEATLSLIKNEEVDDSSLNLKTEEILKKYFNTTQKITDDDLNSLSDQKIDELFLDLFGFIDKNESSNSYREKWELVEVIYSEERAKGILINMSSLETEESELYFRKIESKWLIEKKYNEN